MAFNAPDWSKIHDPNTSWRKAIVGEFSDAYTVPKYVSLFHKYFGSCKNLEFIELGSGTGDLSKAIVESNTGQIKRYTLSEKFDEGVQWLKDKGFEAVHADACDTKLPDQSYDVSISLDVMHHVDEPRKMAVEMMRVARGRCYLVESNGLSVFRKAMELSPGHRAAGERSYLPRQWESFFNNHPGYRITRFELSPFLFAFKVPSPFVGVLVTFNRWIENVPFFRWQCASVSIYVEYERQDGVNHGST